MCINPGRMKPTVFPDPVSAIEIKSCPESIIGKTEIRE